jgi:hypothetical protein
VCGLAIDVDLFRCEAGGCEATIHLACYYGRLASVEEWRKYLRVFDGPDPAVWPKVLCPTCRGQRLPEMEHADDPELHDTLAALRTVFGAIPKAHPRRARVLAALRELASGLLAVTERAKEA